MYYIVQPVIVSSSGVTFQYCVIWLQSQGYNVEPPGVNIL